jgi:transcriptional regulator with XRE-family HTH domain
MSDQNSLCKYVRRILKEKKLLLSEVNQRSGGLISESYISSITKGKVGDLTVGKLLALARGLGVAEEEIIAVASGAMSKDDYRFQESEFAMLFYSYREFSDEDKREVFMLLKLVEREIEWRRARQESNQLKAV